MTLDATTRQSNMRSSIIRYFVESLKGEQNIEVIFDKDLVQPNTRNKTLDRWVSVNIGQTSSGLLSDVLLTIYCLQRKDKEGYKLAQLVDYFNIFNELIEKRDCSADLEFYTGGRKL